MSPPSASYLGISPAKAGGDKSGRRFACVILAAGEAVRMGVAKPAMPFGDSTMVGTVVGSALSAGLEPVVVVTGFHADEVEAAVPAEVMIVRNADAERGNMSSLLVGLAALGDTDGSSVVVLLSDMPQVASGTIDALVSGVVAAGSLAGWVAYTDGTAHPIVLTAPAFEVVRTLSGPKALWRYFESLDPDEMFVLELDTVRPIDINTADDYQAAIRDLPGELSVQD